jgi:hypothetical protein
VDRWTGGRGEGEKALSSGGFFLLMVDSCEGVPVLMIVWDAPVRRVCPDLNLYSPLLTALVLLSYASSLTVGSSSDCTGQRV